MRLLASDPDVQTLYSRIKDGDIDLQPDFQRGEVWSKAKKQRLIDSILRDWHVPPIHVIENPVTKKQEVLDGQQRLTAIRDFIAGALPIDGTIQPYDSRIVSFDGKRFDQLDADTRRQFNRFPIRVFSLVDYKPSEPAELFYRLNQPTNLTSAEQRNAFFGPVRQQIKAVSAILGGGGSSLSTLGFSNARMSFDDVLARVALALRRKSIAEKIRASDLADLYRNDEPLPEETQSVLEAVTRLFAAANLERVDKASLNKAALFSWLIFLARSELHSYKISPSLLSAFFSRFEDSRRQMKSSPFGHKSDSGLLQTSLFRIYDDRSSARVADTSSVILRDSIIWYFYAEFVEREQFRYPYPFLGLQKLREIISTVPSYSDDELSRRLIDANWGDLG